MKYFSWLWNNSRGIRWNTVVRIIADMPPWSGGKTYLTTGLEFYHLRIETLKGFRNVLHLYPLVCGAVSSVLLNHDAVGKGGNDAFMDVMLYPPGVGEMPCAVLYGGDDVRQ